MQHTVLKPVTLSGIGLHSGSETTLKILPAEARHGIVFKRTDVSDRDNIIPARWDCVVDTRLCTVVGNKAGVTVATIEHLMAALHACGIDNAMIELDGPEVPIMDGSSEPFTTALLAVGFKTQPVPRQAIKILRDVVLKDGDKLAILKPSIGSTFKVEIDFPHPSIGRQSYEIEMLEGSFMQEVANCRTFGFLHEVAALRAQGLALGGSLDNAIVLDQGKILNEEGLRRADEFARHKVLDAVGDLYLAGGPILGAFESYKPGHAMNNAILRQLFSQPDAYALVDLYIDLPIHAGMPLAPAAQPVARRSAFA